MLDEICSIIDCNNPVKVKGLCRKHYTYQWKYGKPERKKFDNRGLICSVEGCDIAAKTRGMCSKHNHRFERHGITDDSVAAANKGWYWEGKYIKLTGIIHPNSDSQNRILEHRYVMAQLLGRPLASKEEIHHINNVKHDNRPDNLELWTTSQPPGGRRDDLIKYAYDILKLYKPESIPDNLKNYFNSG